MDFKKLLLGRPNQAASRYIPGSTEGWHPIEDVKDGVIHTKDGRYVRIMEILPNGKLVDKITTYDEYLASDEMAKKRHVFQVNEEDAQDN